MDVLAIERRVADGILETDALVVLGQVRYIGTASEPKVTKKSVKTSGWDYEFDAIIHFDKGVYTEDFAVRKLPVDSD